VDTAHFLHEMTAEDLPGGDLEYIEWAGEAKLLEGLEAELQELEPASYHLPRVCAAHNRSANPDYSST